MSSYSPFPLSFRTLNEALHAAAATDRGITFIESSSDDVFFSYRDLREQALRALGQLQQQGVQRGDEVVLQFASLQQLMVHYWACLLGGITPIPLALADQADNTLKVFTVWRVLERPWLAFDEAKVLEKLEKFAAAESLGEVWAALHPRTLRSSAEYPAGGPVGVESEVSEHEIAFIQFSSGSTGSPKGVVLTHRNLLVNIGDILGSVDFAPSDSFLSWKPISHDFGMIAFHLAPVVGGVNQYRIKTDSFIWSPRIWMSAVDKYRATLLGSPNFGYRHFLNLYRRGPKDGAELGWDLSSIKAIFNGAEPISAGLCEEFLQELAPYGLRRDAMRCGYGLAEASLIVSLCRGEDGVRGWSFDREAIGIGQRVKELTAADPRAVQFVDCGIVYSSMQVRITDADRRPLPEGHVGNVEILGDNVTSRYYRNADATAAVRTPEGWVNTQDLGLMLNGRLIIVGRSKEMIIIGGANYFPHDLEQTILRELGGDQLNKYIVCGVPNPATGSEELVIFVYHKGGVAKFGPSAEQIRTLIRQCHRLPVAHVIPVRSIPKTTSGKVQRFKLVQSFLAGEYDETLVQMGEPRTISAVTKPVAAPDIAVSEAPAAAAPTPTPDDVLERVQSIVAHLVGRPTVEPQATFFDLGLASMNLLTLQQQLEKAFDLTLDSTEALDFPTSAGLAEQIRRKLAVRASEAAKPTETANANTAAADERDIAIIAAATRFPGDADTPQRFWQLLTDGVDPVGDVPADRWSGTRAEGAELATRQGGFLRQVDQFDASLFGITPIEAEALDPQQRLLLEVAHEALENTGTPLHRFHGSRTGVYVGISGSDYPALAAEMGLETGPYTYTGSMFNTAAGRLAYVFGLQGPCVALDTACSSSLTAVHQGIRELRAGACDHVLAVAVNLMLRPDGHLSFSRLNALATSGRCRSFDDSADGYIRSEGAAAVVLKRRADAERDGDPILAVIKGSALNHNGRSGGLTVPSGQAQERLIRAALADAGVEADAIDYVETHGSGTKLGDPQEINALSRVFAGRTRPVLVGSVKSNLGHLEAAAGLAGLIKVTLSLTHGEIPGNLHFERPNRLIDWQRLPLQVVSSRTPWPCRRSEPAAHLRTAAITSLGINGSNAHLVLQEYVAPKVERTAPAAGEPALFTLSAPTAESLHLTAAAFAKADFGDTALSEICNASRRQRSDHRVRYATVVKDLSTLKVRLRKFAEQPPGPVETTPLKRVFLFTGQGSHYHGMGRELYAKSTAFRQAVDACSQLFQPHLGHSLVACVYGEDPADPRLQSTRVAQALVFSIEYGAACHWQALGVKPDLVLGHSIGEYAAACVAGLIGLEDAVRMVALRGELMEASVGEGKMAGILASEAVARELCAHHGDVYVAAVNSPENVTIAGRAEGVDAVIAAAKARRIFTETLPMQRAFHTPLMAESATRLAAALQGLKVHAPQVPMISTQLGAVIASPREAGNEYWANHLCHPVLFQAAVQKAIEAGATVFIEMGGTATLSGLVAQIPAGCDLICLPTMRQGADASQQSLESLAQLYKRGQEVNWEPIGSESRGRPVLLPNTVFNRKRHWLKAVGAVGALQEDAAAASAHRLESPNETAVEGKAQRIQAEMTVEKLAGCVTEMVSEVTGASPADLNPATNLFSLGIDSLMLVQLDKRIIARFGVDIPLNTFFTELHTPAKIAEFVLPRMPAELRLPKNVPVPLEARHGANGHHSPPKAGLNGHGGSALETIVQAQLELMREQLALLRGEPVASHANGYTNGNGQANESHTNGIRTKSIAAPARKDASPRNQLRDMVFQEEPLNPQQRAFVQTLTTRFNAATARSKAYAEQHRDGFADWIATLNFNLTTKELTYPIVAERSQGARFRDVDGNEYIDTAMGYGVCLFGHNPDFVTEALREQLARGMELGPQTALAGEVATLIRELTGAERIAFSNTGTEAVMVALRLARAVTRRPKFVRFITSFHGSFDGVLAELGEDGTAPMAPGIVPSMVEDTIVLQYGSPRSLETIRQRGSEIAAVLVEPVQSRNPGLQPRDYLHALRSLTRELGIALIFDEMVTGFRVGPGGAQAYFDVRADLVTYGKIVGGGMPIGIVAGDARFMDAIDGGAWRFGDASGPTAETTFFAGTFCKHPLAMAASRAVLRKLKEAGPALQAEVTARTERFAEKANAFFQEAGVPVRVKTFASMYRFETIASRDPARLALEMNLLFRLMMERGIYVWERRTCFFSTAHTDADAESILAAIRASVDALRAGGFSLATAEPGMPAATAAAAPTTLSADERRIYVLSRLRGGDAAYHVSGALRFRGRLDRVRLKRVWTKLALRHPVLRSRYMIEEGDVRRCEIADLPVDFSEAEAGGKPLSEAIAGCFEPFDLARPPLWRLRLLAVAPQEHVLVLDFHHLIADGASLSILIQECVDLYEGRALSPATEPFSAYVAQSAQRAATTASDAQLQYWKAQLLPLPTPLALPTDFPRPEQNDFAGAAVHFTVDAELNEAVRQLAREHLTTPFVILLSSYFAFLSKLSQQEELVVGIPYDRRGTYNGYERTVGLFAQTLVIRTRTEGCAGFAEIVAQVKAATTAAYAHADTALDRLVEALNVPRDLGRNPLFDTLFIYEQGDARLARTTELEIETVSVDPRGAAFDLTLELTAERGELRGSFIYATRLFRRETIEAWAASYARLLASLVAAPSAELRSLSVVSEEERVRLVKTFNQTQRDYDRNATLVSLLAKAVRTHGDQPALVFGTSVLTHAQLDRAADVLAARLLASLPRRGNEPRFVAILLRRSPAMIVAMLAALKAGAAYIPLDPDYPKARLSAMLERTQAGVLLSTPDLNGGFDCASHVIDPTPLVEAALADSSLVAPIDEARADDLAYVIFTSGSTGQPKGVMIEHRAAVNFVHGMRDFLKLAPPKRVLGLTTISFDIFVLEVFVTLAAGATLVLADEEEQLDPSKLRALLKHARIDIAQMTPSRLQTLLAGSAPAEVLSGLEMLLVGGEAFPGALLPALKRVPGLRLINVYGPTETTVWSTAKDLSHATEVTIGRPIANTRTYVLDAQRQPVPVGTQGDLYIAGDGLARGYFADPEQTERVFVADPFVPGERMYCTGDRAAWTPQGELICHGRADNQIKLRGYRIELQDIEAAIAAQPAVSQAAVTVREIAAGNPILVAFVVPPSPVAPEEAPLRAQQMREALAQALPAYMVPARVVFVNELPQTPNGKIDRKRLPATLPTETASTTSVEETPDEHQGLTDTLRGIWQQLLGTSRIGRHDSFFDVGGNSYSLMLMHNALEERWPGRLQVSDLFAHPTIDALRKLIFDRQAAAEKTAYEELPFSADFFASAPASGSTAGNSFLRAQSDRQTAARMREVAHRYEVEDFDVVASLHLLYLNKLTKSPVVTVYTEEREGRGFVPVTIDFSRTATFEDILAAVRSSVRKTTHPRPPTSQRRHEHGVISLLRRTTDDGGEGTAPPLHFDIVTSVERQADNLSLRIDYNQRRLCRRKISDFVGNYLRLSDAVLAQLTAKELTARA